MIEKIIAVMLCCSSLSWACPKDSIEYEGTCALMPGQAQTDKGDNPSWVSDEKPSRHPEPAWQRGEVHALMFPPVQESTGVATDYRSETNQK